jgi:hypothetical protein
MARLAKVSTCKITNEPEEQALACGFTVERVDGNRTRTISLGI